MIYKSALKDIIYPGQNREPRVTRYRIALTKNSRLVRAIVHLIANEPTRPQRTEFLNALDVILNKIIGVELTGVRHDCIRLVVQADTQMIDYPITYNALEFRRRRDLVNQPATTADQPIHIRSFDIVGGAVAFYVDREGGKPVSAGRDLHQHYIACLTLYKRCNLAAAAATQEVSLPVPRHRSVFHSGGALTD
ncbi:hypothetical protein OKW35_004614 [Paraburkholderia sp. MM5477-R1]